MKTVIRALIGSAVLVMFLNSLPCVAQNAGSNPYTQMPKRQVEANYGRLPLTFESNQGQTNGQVKFLAHGSGYNVFLTSGQMVLALRPSAVTLGAISTTTQSNSSHGVTNAAIPGAKESTSIQLSLVGSNKNPSVVGEDQQPGKVNYFIGNDPKQWHTNVAVYKRVHYSNVYPGIDVIYYGNQSRVEHDFVVAPGADPNQIQLDIQGIDRLGLASNGDLMLVRGADELRLQAPVLYQQFNGMKVPVSGGYVITNSTRVSFTIGAYDKTLPLVIDPVLVYSTYLGGSGYDQAVGITVDSTGAAYITGCTDSTNFPGANGPAPSGTNAFVVKIDVSGSSVVYADYIGGSSYDCANAMAMDSSNDVYITGVTYSSDYPLVNPFQATGTGAGAAFVTEVSPDGSTLVYSTYLGGNDLTAGVGIGVDSLGDFYVAGSTNATNFPTVNAYQAAASPNQSGEYGQYSFLTEFAPGGASLNYSTYYSGSQTAGYACEYGTCYPAPFSVVTGLAVDANGNSYLTGYTETYDFPTTTGSYQTTNASNNAIVGFVGKFVSSGSLLYSTYFGATSSSQGLNPSEIAFDSAGAAYLVGTTSAGGNAIPVTTPNLCDPSQTQCDNGFIAKFDPTGANVLYSTYLSPTIDAEPVSVAVDSSGDAYVFSSSAGGPTSGLVDPIEQYPGGENVFIQEIDPSGGTQLFSTFLGGSNYDTPGGIAVDASGNIYLSGSTQSVDFPVTVAAIQNNLAGSSNIFISKIGAADAPAVSLNPTFLQFPIVAVGSSSQPNTVVLRNMGSAPLTFSSKNVTGDFSETDTCNMSVPSASECTFTVTFTPTQAGPRFGAITLVDNAVGSPHTISLSGEGAAPVALLTPTTLTLGSELVNQTSAAQTVTLTNNGNATLNIGNVAITAEYAQTNNCPASLAIGSSCQIQVTFTPTAWGAQNGTLTITDNAPGSPQTVALTGSGYVTTATVTPASLSFGNQAVSTISGSQAITITNTGSSPVSISAVTVTGPFTQTNNCVGVAVQTSCTINVAFAPTSGGNVSGLVTINDNAEGNPHVVSLSGTGLAGYAQLSTTTMNFAPGVVGITSSAQTVTVTNSGNSSFTFTSIQAIGDFSQTNNCSTIAANGGSCTIQVTFTPTSSGSRSGAITLVDSATNSPQSIALTGNGIDFSVTASGGSATVQPGSSATYQLSITPVGGSFSSAIALACSGAPAYSTCSINPSSVIPGANSASATVTVRTAGTSSRSFDPAREHRSMLATWMLFPGVGIFGAFLLTNDRKRMLRLLLLLFVAAGLILCTSCSLSGSQQQSGSGTPAGTYTLVVIGSSGSVQHVTSLTLTVE